MIAIVGGGISGLTLAYFLEKNGVEYTLFEKSQDVGGFIKSEKVNDYWLEYGPNSLLCGEEVREFLNELNLTNDLIEANDSSNTRFIIKNGKPTKLPSSPISMFFGSFFSWSTKRKIFKERKFKPTDHLPEESLSSLINRHFGKEVVDYLLKPFIAGIYAGDPDQLVAKYSFPKLKEYEQEHGSILKGFIKNKGGVRRKTVSFKKGMIQLPQTILSQVNHVKVNTSVDKIRRLGSEYELGLSDGETVKASNVIFAGSPYALSNLVKEHYEGLEKVLLQLKTPSIAAVHTVYKKGQVKLNMNGFGVLNPQNEKCFAAGTIWSSSVFDNKAPKDEILLSTFVGGMQYQGNDSVSEEEIKEKVHLELAKQYGIKGNPVFQKVTKWKKSIPQYGIEMKEVHQWIDNLEKDNIFVCSNWKNGISLEECIKNAKALAFKLSNL